MWVKSKCPNREEFVVGWTDPTRSRPYIGGG
jgi:hypothetical protein